MIFTMTTFYFRRISGEKKASISLWQYKYVQKASWTLHSFFYIKSFSPVDEILKNVVNICGACRVPLGNLTKAKEKKRTAESRKTRLVFVIISNDTRELSEAGNITSKERFYFKIAIKWDTRLSQVIDISLTIVHVSPASDWNDSAGATGVRRHRMRVEWSGRQWKRRRTQLRYKTRKLSLEQEEKCYWEWKFVKIHDTCDI